MKTNWLVALLAVFTAHAQNVFVLGSNTALPPDLNGNVQPVAPAPPATTVAVPATTVNVNVNVNGGAASPYAYPPTYAAYDAYYPQQYYSPTVTYIGSPGTCGPNYYNYYPYQSSSVIYFGGMQAARHGYHFRHCR